MLTSGKHIKLTIILYISSFLIVLLFLIYLNHSSSLYSFSAKVYFSDYLPILAHISIKHVHGMEISKFNPKQISKSFPHL